MDPSQILQQILSAAGVSAAQLPAEVDFSPFAIARAVVILVIIYILARIVRGILNRALARAQVEPRAKTMLLQVVFYGIISLGIVWVLGGFGLSVVVLTIAAGFALKDLIQNFAAGLLIMGTRPFQEGDWIVIGPNEGRVVSVGWRGTFLDAFDGRRVIVPNSSIMTSVVTNNSLTPQLRSTIALSINQLSEFERVEADILGALAGVEGIAPTPAPLVLIESVTPKLMNLKINFWVLDPVNNQAQVTSNAIRAAMEALAASDLDPSLPIVTPSKSTSK